MITVRVVDRGASDLFARARALGARPEPILRAMGTTLKSVTEGTFNSVGASYRPIPWPAKRDGTPSNLQQSTTLAKSFFLAVAGKSAEVGNPTRYAAIHQFGGTIRPKNGKALRFQSGDRWHTVAEVKIPARPFFPIVGSGGSAQFTPRAGALIVRAGERALARALGGTVA
jgi:phage gpG-like protein